MTSTPEPGNRRALLVGIDRYPRLSAFDQLEGAANDARAMFQTLTGRFGFAEKDVLLLLDEAATRDAILAALDQLAEATETDDVVVFHFSGHGSQVPDQEGDEADGWDETLVPSDAGRAPHPNREITDDEIYDWLLRLIAKTPYVTLIFDCCHSATLNRDDRGGFGGKVRGIERDERRIEDLPPPSERARRATAARTAGWPPRKGDSGWLPWSRRWTLLAGCAADQESHEMRPPGLISTRHGAMTYFLVQELQNLQPGETWRNVHERIVSQVATLFRRSQEPQLEGALDREVFGVGLVEPLRFIPVEGRCRDGRVLLGAGAACGLTAGSIWEVYPQGARDAAPGTELGLIEITGVSAFSSEGKVLSESGPPPIGRGCRAVERSHAYDTSLWTVDLAIPEAWQRENQEEMETLEKAIEDSPLVKRVRGDDADARVYLLEPHRRAPLQEPVPVLSALERPVWVVVGRDDRLALPVRRADAFESVFDLAENLEKLARFQHALSLDNPTSALRGKVDLILERLTNRGPVGAREEKGTPVFFEGELLALRLLHLNPTGQQLYFYVVDFGLSGRVSLIYPVEGTREPLARDAMSIGTRIGQELSLSMPWDFPFEEPGRPGASGLEIVKLFVTTEPVKFELLFQDSFRKHKEFLPGIDDNPLGRLLSQALWGRAFRGKLPGQPTTPEDWTTVTRRFLLRRR